MRVLGFDNALSDLVQDLTIAKVVPLLERAAEQIKGDLIHLIKLLFIFVSFDSGDNGWDNFARASHQIHMSCPIYATFLQFVEFLVLVRIQWKLLDCEAEVLVDTFEIDLDYDDYRQEYHT